MAPADVLNRYDCRLADGLNVFKNAVLLLVLFNSYRGLKTVRKGDALRKPIRIEVYFLTYKCEKVLL